MQVDPGPLQSYALSYHISSIIVDTLIFSFWIAGVTLVRYFVRKRNKPNLHPSNLWYVPKIIGMGLMVVNFIHLVFEGAVVNKLSENGNFVFVILSTLIGAGLLYWGYRVIWKRVIPRGV
jgi:hypothetical protein